MPESPWYYILGPAAVATLLIAISWWPAAARWVKLGAALAGIGIFFLAPGDGWIFAAALVAVAASLQIGTTGGFRAPARLMISAASVLIVLIPFALRTRSITAEIDELRERYPLVSIRDRLAYESPPAVPPADQERLFGNLIRQMDLFTEEYRERGNAEEAYLRTFSLGQLHSDAHRAFATSPGFGFKRILRPRFQLLPQHPVPREPYRRSLRPPPLR